jgi:peptide/nickel transport system permease protein
MATVNDPADSFLSPAATSDSSPAVAVAGGTGVVAAPAAAGLAPVPAGGESSNIGGVGTLMLRVFLENKLALVGVGLVLFMILFSWLGPVFYSTPQGTTVQITTTNYLAAPNGAHLLGTDQNGYDQLGRLMVGGQTSIEIALAAAAAATMFGVIYGAISGFVGGAVDAVMMRVVDIFLAFPVLLLVVVIAVIIGTTLPLLILIVAFVAWLVPSRLVRGETLSLRTREYVQAVRGMGGSRRRIVLRHIVPNTIGTIIVNATLQVADAMLLLAALAYLGIGLPPPATSWGQILSNGVQYVTSSPSRWWTFYPAGICIVLVVIGFNFVGDALRDSFETRLVRR